MQDDYWCAISHLCQCSWRGTVSFSCTLPLCSCESSQEIRWLKSFNHGKFISLEHNIFKFACIFIYMTRNKTASPRTCLNLLKIKRTVNDHIYRWISTSSKITCVSTVHRPCINTLYPLWVLTQASTLVCLWSYTGCHPAIISYHLHMLIQCSKSCKQTNWMSLVIVPASGVVKHLSEHVESSPYLAE